MRRRGLVQRWCKRKHVRLISARSRRALAQQLRRATEEPRKPNPTRHRHRAVLHYRAATVRTDLLETAALLEHAYDPDPECVAVLRDLLRNDASPLYDANVDASELRATLDTVRADLRRPP